MAAVKKAKSVLITSGKYVREAGVVGTRRTGLDHWQGAGYI